MLALCLLAAGLAGAQETNAPGTTPPLTWPKPILPPTNAASATFLESHPETVQEPSLSLHPAPPPASPPETPPPHPTISGGARQFLFPEGAPAELADHLLVVYNTKDHDSKSLAEYYAARRSIPAERVLGIACPTDEEITRAQYNATVREPIISYIYEKGWMTRRSEPVQLVSGVADLLLATHNDVWAMVLMRGVPLKIANDPTLSGSLEGASELQTNAAAVDSELALLPIFGLPEGGFVPNVFFDVANTGFVRAGPELATKLILVTRLDGPTAADVRRMIDDTLYAEENRLAGRAVIDSRGLFNGHDAYASGDEWIRRSEEMLVHDGWPMEFDTKPDVLPPSDPCNHVAFYLGWYHDGVVGPWATPPPRFARGALAYHLHSFSAVTVRNPTSEWVGPLIVSGAAATMGTVYEPYLDLTPHLDIFTSRILAGNYFAEAAYASQRALSWMTTVVGDPLYRPFLKSLDAAVDGSPADSSHHEWLLLQQVQRALIAGQIENTPAALEQELDSPGAVAQEGLGDLLVKLTGTEAFNGARIAYAKAEKLDTEPIDHIRVGLKLARLYQDHAEGDQAESELKKLRERYPVDASRFGVPGALASASTGAPAVAPAPAPPPETIRPPRPPGPPQPPKPY